MLAAKAPRSPIIPPPKDIKTTVNPIKTLTPRFTVRAVEKMQKKEKKEAK